MTTEVPTTSTIYCDKDGCDFRLVVNRDISEHEAMAIVAVLGGESNSGTQRTYHRCAKCVSTRSTDAPKQLAAASEAA